MHGPPGTTRSEERMRIRIDIDDGKASVREPAATRPNGSEAPIAAIDEGSAAALARQTGATDAGPAPTTADVAGGGPRRSAAQTAWAVDAESAGSAPADHTLGSAAPGGGTS